jgi:hypothetical protein
MRRHFTLLIIALALTPLSAQTYRIAGTVVSSVDNHPLQRASIQIANVNDPQQIQTTISDEDGRFAFAKVPVGLFELQGSAPGYRPTLYEEHDEGFNTGIVTGAQVDTESLTLKVLPDSSITGTVVNEAAEPVGDATVQLFVESHTFGDGRILLASGTNTDDRGRFELPHLKPGTYFVTITARPWYAVHPQLAPEPAGNVTLPNGVIAVQRRPASNFADSIDPSLDVAYPTEFYPGTTDSASAAPIVIHAGDSPDLHFLLAPQPAVSVTIPRSPPKPGQPDSGVPPQLRMSIFGQLEPAMQDEMRMSPTETVISGLAPGDYTLTTSPNRSSGGIPLHLAQRVTEATPASSESGLAHVHVIARMSDGSSPPHLWIGLVQSHATPLQPSEVDDKGHVDLDASPGDYYFQIEDGSKVLFAQKILSGEKPLPDGNIHLTADSSRFFVITVAEGTHTLKGVARKDGKGFPGALILLFPTSEAADVHTFFRQQSDLDGSFDIKGIAPGSYTLLAIEDGWDLDWQRDKALDRYLPAQKIHIPDTAEKTHYLTEFVTVQSR